MTRGRIGAALVALASIASCDAYAQIHDGREPALISSTSIGTPSQAQLPWVTRGRGSIGGLAGINLPEGLRYLPTLPSERFLQMMGNPPISDLRDGTSTR